MLANQALFPITPEHPFTLDPSFIDQFRGRQPKWGPIGYVVSKRTYARPTGNGQRTEEFWETLVRVVNGWGSILRWHFDREGIQWDEEEVQVIAQKMFIRMWQFKLLPPGRGLWAMGTKHVWKHGSAAMNNCCFVSSESIKMNFSDPFTFMMEMLMMGVGVGGDTRGAGRVTIQQPIINGHAFIVPDSRRGWIELIRIILDAYVGKSTLPHEIIWDEIRKAGEPLKTFGGTAAGPGPLRQLAQDIHDILTPLIGKLITSGALVDIQNAIGRCVVSGNIRRSAEIILGDHKDKDFLHLKDPAINSERMMKWGWTSNNSIFAQPGMDYSYVADLTAENGEPGYFWQRNAMMYGRMKDAPLRNPDKIIGVNPCSEIALEDRELCNLIETFPANHDSLADYIETLEIAYYFTKVVSLFPTNNTLTNAVVERNRRLGISQSGIAQSFVKHGYLEHFGWCDKGYEFIDNLDETVSALWNVPESVKLTTVKPSGTVSLLAGASPGIHFPYSEYYWRTVRISKQSKVLVPLYEAGYRIEDDVTNPSKTAVVYFPVHEDPFERSRSDLTIWEQMEYTAKMQHYWADNQVSVTVTFKPEEKSEIKKVLEHFDTRLKSVSFLPLENHGYAQAPLMMLTEDEYNEAISLLSPIQINGNSNDVEPKYCSNDTCSI